MAAQVIEAVARTRVLNTENNFVHYKYNVQSQIYKEGETVTNWFLAPTPCDQGTRAAMILALPTEFPALDTAAKAAAYFKASNSRICAYIRETQSLATQSVMTGIMYEGDAAYLALLARYESKSTTKCIDILKGMTTMTINEKETLPQLKARIDEAAQLLVDALVQQGQTLIDMLKTMALLDAMPDSDYDVTKILAESDVTLTYDKAVMLLRHANERISAQRATKVGTAFQATKLAVKETKLTEKVVCEYCGDHRHESASCYKQFPHLRPKPRGKPRGKEGKGNKATRADSRRNYYDESSEEDESEASGSETVQHKYSKQAVKGTKKAWLVRARSGSANKASRFKSESTDINSIANNIMNLLGNPVKREFYKSNDDLLKAAKAVNGIEFCVDGGCTDHFVKSEDGLTDIDRSAGAQYTVESACGSESISTGVGAIRGKLTEVAVMPDFTDNLLAEIKLYNEGYTIIKGKKTGILILNPEGKLEAQGYVRDGLFRVMVSTGKNNGHVAMPVTGKKHPAKRAEQMVQTTAAGESTNGKHTGEVVQEPLTQIGEVKNTMGLTPLVVAQIEKWYARMGHIGAKRAYDTLMRSTGHNVPIEKISYPQFCSVVEDDIIFKKTRTHQRKHKNKRYAGNRDTAISNDKVPWHTIHMDIKMMDKKSRFGAKYALLLTDEATGAKIPLFLVSKTSEELVEELERFIDDLPQHIKLGILKVQTKQLFRADNGGEQKSSRMRAFLRKHEARIRYTDPHNSASNGRAERSIGVIDGSARAIKMSADMKKTDWDTCYATACIIDKILSTRSNPNRASPSEMLYGKKPDISWLRRMGSKAFVHDARASRKASQDQTEEGKLIGYTADGEKYKIGFPDGRIIETSNVTFIEKLRHGDDYHVSNGPANISTEEVRDKRINAAIRHSGLMEKGRSDHISISIEDESKSYDVIVTTLSIPVPPGAPPPIVLPNLVPEDSDDDEEEEIIIDRETPSNLREPSQRVRFHSSLVGAIGPKSRANQAIRVKTSEANKDHRVVQSKAACMIDILSPGDPTKAKAVDVICPLGVVPLDNIFVTAHKYKADGVTYDRTKTRMTPNGGQQVPGVDYFEDEVSYAVIDLDSLALMNLISVSRGKRGMNEVVVDVISAFSSQPLRSPKPLYAKYPRGVPHIPGHVLMITRALEGLKQSGHIWYRKCVRTLKANTYKQSNYDPCLWYKWKVQDLTLIAVATDDFRIMTDNIVDQEEIVAILSSTFDGAIKVYPLEMFNGVKYEIDRDAIGGPTISTSQEACIDEILQTYNMVDCNPTATPMASGTKLLKGEQPDQESLKFPVANLIGSARWIARNTIWEINHALTRINEHVRAPTRPVITALKKVVQYLKGRKEFRRVFSPCDLNICGMSDADYNGEPNQNTNGGKSISAIIVYCEGGGIISTSANFQKTTSRSTCESEARAASSCAQKMMCYRNILEEVGLIGSGVDAQPGTLDLKKKKKQATLGVDNQAAIGTLSAAGIPNNARHVKMDHNYIRDLVADKEVVLQYVETESMIADILTKALPRVQFTRLRDKANACGRENIHSKS